MFQNTAQDVRSDIRRGHLVPNMFIRLRRLFSLTLKSTATLVMTSAVLFISVSHAQSETAPETLKPETLKPDPLKEELQKTCVDSMKSFPGASSSEKLTAACAEVQWMTGCLSSEGRKIFHVDKKGQPLAGQKSQKILTLALIHGDELPSGSVARSWMERLAEISSRNDWRIVPVLNPDGVLKKTRTNGRGVDVNRNFPTADWEAEALKAWETQLGSNPRRYPGASPASEVETKCAIAHIKDFKPDFIISVHTPLGVLDFDGPKKIPVPTFKPLPWTSLGHFPGSLGRYMWKEHGVPVLTVELKGDEVVRRSFEEFDRLQDITGTVAIQAQKAIDKLGVERKEVNYEPKMSQIPKNSESQPN